VQAISDPESNDGVPSAVRERQQVRHPTPQQHPKPTHHSTAGSCPRATSGRTPPKQRPTRTGQTLLLGNSSKRPIPVKPNPGARASCPHLLPPRERDSPQSPGPRGPSLPTSPVPPIRLLSPLRPFLPRHPCHPCAATRHPCHPRAATRQPCRPSLFPPSLIQRACEHLSRIPYPRRRR